MGERSVVAVPQTPQALQPTRDPRATLPDLLEVLLNKGVYLDLDLIITIADIPLIGVNLRATIAGIETMLEYGMMRSWDEQTRAWVRRSISRHLPLADGEEIVARMAGGHRQEEPYETWRPGTVYLTTHRLVVHRREPAETLWQAPLAGITAVDLRTERAIGGEDRTRLLVTTPDGEVLLSAAEPQRLLELLRQHGVGAAGPRPGPPGRPAPVLEGQMWYLERRAGGPLWRGGTATLDPVAGLTWKGALDARPAVRLRPGTVTAVAVERARVPAGEAVIVVGSPAGEVRLAAGDPEPWVRELRRLTAEDAGEGTA
ncbi:gas vesicle protein [Georgenia thermotolerans]|uniref:Gas vesicle protein n=1 Tax=Georgenia thermotolerans TaxID=527326 RepID=A0A7J5UNV0_9MICO|nr:gas vesicle protein [Georgenia thermotolerans]KAE8763911.1 gas vesicle protein [Georgenia thermotolerans]